MYVCTDPPWSDWGEPISKVHPRVQLVEKIDILKERDFKIIPISEKQYELYKDHPGSVFKNDKELVDTFENKAKFAKYMMGYHPEHCAKTYFYNFSDETYISPVLDEAKGLKKKFISKKVISASSFGIILTSAPDLQSKGVVITEYLEHTSYCVGHFLVYNGKIIERIYFWVDKAPEGGVKRGNIKDYSVEDTARADDAIFDSLFKEMNYSGFACADFIVKENKVILFEINARLGGSLVYDQYYFNKFINSLILINDDICSQLLP